MIGFWIAAALLTALVLLLLLRPLMRPVPQRPAGAGDGDGTGGEDFQQAIYRDQLGEVEREVERGLLSPEQAQAVRAEIGRRLLSAAAQERATPASPAATAGAPRRWAAVLLLLVPTAALGLYLKVGSPDLPAQPAAQRGDAALAGGGLSPDAAANLAALDAATRQRPDDAGAWTALGSALSAAGQYDKAAVALGKAAGLDPGNATVQGGLAEALTQAGDGIVSPAARKAIAAALAIDPAEPRARFYEGLALRQGGDLKGAIAHWAAFLADSPADAPWVPFVRGQIGAAATEAGLDPSAVTPQPKPAIGTSGPGAPNSGAPNSGAPGPSADDVAAASGMAAGDRAQMIRGMVDRLAARLHDHPEDPAGWQRLAQAYQVLGDKDKAAEAQANAARYAGAAAGAQTPAADPDEAMRKAVAAMTPAERAAKIDSLLAGLAAQAQAHPGDGVAWARLAQAYDVTGHRDQAGDAWRKARAAAPKDAGIALAYARSLLPADGAAPPPAFFAVLNDVLKIDPDNPQALWYLGQQAVDAGQAARARDLWGRLLTRLPPDSPDRAELERRLAALPAGKP